jgi:hypothetical protein
MFVSYTNVFLTWHCKVEISFTPLAQYCLHDYIGFCAQPVRPALGKKKILKGRLTLKKSWDQFGTWSKADGDSKNQRQKFLRPTPGWKLVPRLQSSVRSRSQIFSDAKKIVTTLYYGVCSLGSEKHALSTIQVQDSMTSEYKQTNYQRWKPANEWFRSSSTMTFPAPLQLDLVYKKHF